MIHYVGDLCYVMHPQWKELCNKIFHNERVTSDGIFKLDSGVVLAIFSTKYGAGVYQDEDGNT